MSDKCKKCNSPVYTNASVSRCLRCGKATEDEVHPETYFKRKSEGKCTVCGDSGYMGDGFMTESEPCNYCAHGEKVKQELSA